MTRTAIAQRDLPTVLARLDPESYGLALFLVESGARLAEGLAARATDIGEINERESVEVRIHGVKGRGERISFLTRQTACILTGVCVPDRPDRFSLPAPHSFASTGASEGPAEALLFPRSRRHYQRALQRAGFDARSLRHTFATALLDNGADLITVMTLMGHVRADSTRCYFDWTEERMIVLARSIVMHLKRANRLAHTFVDIREGRLDP